MVESTQMCTEFKSNKFVPDWYCSLPKGHPGPHRTKLDIAWRPPWRELPLGMKHKRKAPQSSHKAYPWGQRSVHCRICCKSPTSSTHFIKPAAPGNCQGEFGTNGAEKIACCPKCGTKWECGFMSTTQMELYRL